VGDNCILGIKREPQNPHDKDALLVMMGNKPIGRVPRELSTPLSRGLSFLGRCAVNDIFLLYSGEMEHDGPTPGGGPKLCALYTLKVTDEGDHRSLSKSIRRIVGSHLTYTDY
jgi:hypothetical protein